MHAHLEDEEIQRLLHGELGEREASVRAHLASCAKCTQRLEDAEREESEVLALLGKLSHAEPRRTAQSVIRAARAPRLVAARWAAGIVLALAAGGAAYALPGSPVRDWVRAAVDWVAGREPVTPVMAPVPSSQQLGAGIAVDPGLSLVIEFLAKEGVERVRARLINGSTVVVRAENGAATFTSEVDRLVIDNRGSTASFEIEIPRDAPRVEVRAGDWQLFLKEGTFLSRPTAPLSSEPRNRPRAY